MRLTGRLGALDGCPDDFAYRPAMHAVHSQPLPRAWGGGGGAGLSPCCGLGGEGAGGRRPRDARRGGEGGRLAGWGGGRVAAPSRPAPAPLPFEGAVEVRSTAALGGGSVSSPGALHRSSGLGGGGGRASAASSVGLPSDSTPRSGCLEYNLHPAAPPPHRHEPADREPRSNVGIAPRAGVLVLRGRLSRPRGWQHRVPHGVHPRDGGQHRGGGCVRVPGRGEGPVAPQEAPDGAAVGDTHAMAPGALGFVVLPLDQVYPAMGRFDPGPRGGCPGSAGREAAQVPEGRQQGGDPGELHALPPMEAGGPPDYGRPAIPPAEGLVERGARHRQALGNAIQGRQPPPGVRARVRPVEEASHEDILQAEKAGGRPLEGVEGAGDGREGPLRVLAVRGQRAAHLGELAADGRCRVAPRHPAAHLLLPGQPAAAGERLHPAPAHPVRARRREGVVRGVREAAAGLSLCSLRCAEQEGRRRTSRWRGGGYLAGTHGSTTAVAPCPNIPPGWPCPWAPR